ncbi:glycosyltransferase [Candidatus Binatia bacterium]|nr:glycosyltransferase [Candidatus Binatia bacterium]
MTTDRVLVIGPCGPGQLPESYARAFERLSCDVHRFDSDRAYFQAGVGAGNRWIRRALRSVYWRRINAATVEAAREVRPRLVVAFKGAYLEPATIALVRRELGVPFANYYPDNPYCGIPWNPRKTSAQRRNLLDALRAYDHVWIWERGLAHRLRADGVTASFLPFAADPEVFRPGRATACEECGVQHAVAFVGQHSDKREVHVGAVRRHAVALWGARWERARMAFSDRHVIHRRPAFGADCARQYAAAGASLNVVDDLNMPGHNMRTFEIPASGGLMVSAYTEEQAELFPEGEAALYYRDPAEIDDCLDRVIADPHWAQSLRQRALAIAAGNSYTDRARTMLREFGS